MMTEIEIKLHIKLIFVILKPKTLLSANNISFVVTIYIILV